MCKNNNQNRSHPANGPKLTRELKANRLSINGLAKTSGVDRNTIRSMLRSENAFRSSFQKVAKVLYDDPNDWLKLTAKSSCVIVTFDFDCDLPDNSTVDDAMDFIRRNPDRFLECFEKIRALTESDPQVADITFACIRIRMVATAEDAERLLKAFKSKEFQKFGVLDVFVEKPGRKVKRWIFSTWMLALLGCLMFLAALVGWWDQGRQGIFVVGTGRPVIDQNRFEFSPGKRAAEVSFSVENRTRESVMFENECVFDFSSIGIDHEVRYPMKNGPSKIVLPGQEATVVYGVNNLGTTVLNTEWKRVRESYVECSVQVRLLSVETGEVVYTATIPIFVLPDQRAP